MQKENEKEHHTNEFANMTMVLRRGQTFKVKMTFQRAFHKQADKISLDLCLGRSIKARFHYERGKEDSLFLLLIFD